MRRPIRTRRLSIVATVSCAAFLVVASAGIRSFWITDELDLGQHRAIGLIGGSAIYVRTAYKITPHPFRYQSGHYKKIQHPPGILGFVIWTQVLRVSGRNFKVFFAGVPLWPLLLLLLIAPARWMMALPVRAAAFPVVTDGEPRPPPARTDTVNAHRDSEKWS